MNPSSLDVLVVGSGLSAYGALLKLIDIPNITITLFDIGLSSPYQGQNNQEIPNSKALDNSYYPYGLNDLRWNVDLHSKRICSSHSQWILNSL